MKTVKAKTKAKKEVSAGGIVRRGDELLVVKVQNLSGQVVWTFPKGHLEGDETPEQAAVREVHEETGWLCEPKKDLMTVQYFFRHNGKLIHKFVHWFLMDPVSETGKCDPEEILDCRWLPFKEAADLLEYPSDRKILARLKAARKNTTAK